MTMERRRGANCAETTHAKSGAHEPLGEPVNFRVDVWLRGAVPCPRRNPC